MPARVPCPAEARHSRPRRTPPALATLLALLLCAGGITTAPAQDVADEPAVMDLSSFPRSALTIHAAGGKGHVFNVWLADTPERQQQGLMFVRDLPADEGMLFVHRQPRVAGMWMKNTYIALDMLFIDARGQVVDIFERTVPHSLQTIGSRQPVKGVLELRGGEVRRRGLRVGDRVEHPAFRAPARAP
jgi:uncharacterized membrane protein (UPF0127 family)